MAPPTRRDLERANRRWQRAAEEATHARTELDLLVVRLVESGTPQTEIAAELGVTKARVHNIVVKTRRDPGEGGEGEPSTP